MKELGRGWMEGAYDSYARSSTMAHSFRFCNNDVSQMSGFETQGNCFHIDVCREFYHEISNIKEGSLDCNVTNLQVINPLLPLCSIRHPSGGAGNPEPGSGLVQTEGQS